MQFACALYIRANRNKNSEAKSSYRFGGWMPTAWISKPCYLLWRLIVSNKVFETSILKRVCSTLWTLAAEKGSSNRVAWSKLIEDADRSGLHLSFILHGPLSSLADFLRQAMAQCPCGNTLDLIRCYLSDLLCVQTSYSNHETKPIYCSGDLDSR